VMALREKPAALRGQWPAIALAGFLGMFICGGPVYVAGITTSAINLSLIMALAPIVVLLFSFAAGRESAGREVAPCQRPLRPGVERCAVGVGGRLLPGGRRGRQHLGDRLHGQPMRLTGR